MTNFSSDPVLDDNGRRIRPGDSVQVPNGERAVVDRIFFKDGEHRLAVIMVRSDRELIISPIDVVVLR